MTTQPPPLAASVLQTLERLTQLIHHIALLDGEKLVHKNWRQKHRQSDNPLTGTCYAAAQASYELLGGKEAGWKACLLTHATWPEMLAPGETHWYLQHNSGRVYDPSAGQFPAETAIPYQRGKGAGFLGGIVAQRSQFLMDAIQKQDPLIGQALREAQRQPHTGMQQAA